MAVHGGFRPCWSGEQLSGVTLPSVCHVRGAPLSWRGKPWYIHGAPLSWKAKSMSSSASFSTGDSSINGWNCPTPSRQDRHMETGGVARAILSPFRGWRGKSKEKAKFELLSAIAPLERGSIATPEDCARVEQIVEELEKLNPTKEPLKSPLLSGKWKLIYTTSDSILKKSRPKMFRPNGPIYQAINTATLRAQNLETWPFFNQVTANLDPVDERKLVVKFDYFKIAGLFSFSRRRNTGFRGGVLEYASQLRCLVDTCVQERLPLVGGEDVKESHKEQIRCVEDACVEERLPLVGEEDVKESHKEVFKNRERQQASDLFRGKQKDSPHNRNYKWCGLCGNGNGQMVCGRCMGEGRYATRPGLGGVGGKVGLARCKTCLGKKTVPCLVCRFL